MNMQEHDMFSGEVPSVSRSFEVGQLRAALRSDGYSVDDKGGQEANPVVEEEPSYSIEPSQEPSQDPSIPEYIPEMP
jgi:hypothetical protein